MSGELEDGDCCPCDGCPGHLVLHNDDEFYEWLRCDTCAFDTRDDE